jgi:hypothetical protein
MAVFRIEKTSDYTVMSNHHLKNKNLSLKAKGLLSQMLSLPDDWDYTLKGLATLNRESIDAIREAVKELENAGYIERFRSRNDKGHLKATDYTIYERPQKPKWENPTLDKPIQDKPTLENPMQLNTNRLNTKESNTNTYLSDLTTHHQAQNAIRPDEMDTPSYEQLLQSIKKQIEFDHLMHQYPKDRLNEIVDLMAETLISQRPKISIASDQYPAALVKKRLQSINVHHIHYLFETLSQTKTHIRNIKQYLLTALFNAPATIDSYYTAKVNHDFSR